MTDLVLDETALFARFGAYVRHLNWEDAANQLPNVTAGERAQRRAAIAETFEIPADVDASALDEIAGVLAAFDRLVAANGLCALANHYEGAVAAEHAGILAASNPAFSILMREGIACPVEGDMKVALAMLALKRVAGTATLAELYSMDFENDLLILGHSGAADVSIGSKKPVLKRTEVFHGKSGGGFLTQTYPQPGPMTLLSLTQGANGDFRFVAAEGEIVDGPAMELGDTNCRVRFGLGLRGFVNAWANEGPTHHAVMAPGHHIERIACVAKLFGVEMRVVG
jgi:L-arabinose isomerase